MNINVNELMNWTYITLTPPSQFTYEKVFIFILISAFLLCIPLYFLSRKKITPHRVYRKILARVGIFIFSLDLLGWVVFAGRIYQLQFISMRLILLIWLGFCILSIVFLVLYFILWFGLEMKQYKKEEERRKYLP